MAGRRDGCLILKLLWAWDDDGRDSVCRRRDNRRRERRSCERVVREVLGSSQGTRLAKSQAVQGRPSCMRLVMGRRLRCSGTPGSWDGEPPWGMGRLAGPEGKHHLRCRVETSTWSRWGCGEGWFTTAPRGMKISGTMGITETVLGWRLGQGIAVDKGDTVGHLSNLHS
ncbi:hypothetical protein MLD38_037530 [Melastoma candidum]|uniref:Uncharacterized protein n=1 Tax=Melastoma candidum TaxID=119954 RepID=A0ACB9LP61_9MYRT|nr:hypothetical protein MLD38_037530 [Melastoma candidum]